MTFSYRQDGRAVSSHNFTHRHAGAFSKLFTELKYWFLFRKQA